MALHSDSLVKPPSLLARTVFAYSAQTASQERDAMTAEMKRKESGMGVMQAEKQRLVEQIRDVSGRLRFPVVDLLPTLLHVTLWRYGFSH